MRGAHKFGEDYILSLTDLERLTGVEHADAQRSALRKMGIKFGVRPDERGTPIVTRDAARAYTGEAANEQDKPTLNLASIGGKKTKAR